MTPPATAAAVPATARPAARPAAARRRFAGWPWRDKAGRFSPLRATCLALLIAPGAWLLGRWAAGDLGGEPVEAVLEGTGLWALRISLVALAVTPFRRLFNVPQIFAVRRMIGLSALFYGLAHLLFYIAEEGFDLVKVGTEIALRFYLTIGFVGLLGFAVLGWTSTDHWMRRLGVAWKRLHRMAYPLTALVLLHFFIQSKADVSEATVVLGLFLWLMLWRAMPGGWETRVAPLLGLALATLLATVALEYAWYALATKVPAGRVLWANLDVTFGLRPALWVGLVGLALATVPLFTRPPGHAIR